MFMQLHILRSMPPGNLNRDDTGQPKQCIFGGVTRGRISSQCIKRNIRKSEEFTERFGDSLAARTKFLPKMVAEELKELAPDVLDDELKKVMKALAGQFKKSEKDDSKDDEKPKDESGQTPQLVFIPPRFAEKIAELLNDLRKNDKKAYESYIQEKKQEKKKKAKTDEEKKEEKTLKDFKNKIFEASKTLTVDIALFGRMTTSDLLDNTEATCQVAHAISTHETIIESDYFTAIDDLKGKYSSTQMEASGAAHIGSGETGIYYSSAVYYEYLNLDISAIEKHLPSWSQEKRADIASILVKAAVNSNPTGKQNSFAAHGVPELIVIDISGKKRPISYANAFLQPAKGGSEQNLMTKSAEMLKDYIESVGNAYSPSDMQRLCLAVGSATAFKLEKSQSFPSIDELAQGVVDRIVSTNDGGAR